MVELSFSSSQTGKIVTAIFVKNGSLADGPFTLSEGSVEGEYFAIIDPVLAPGRYTVLFFYDGNKVGSTYLYYDGNKEIDFFGVLSPTLQIF